MLVRPPIPWWLYGLNYHVLQWFCVRLALQFDWDDANNRWENRTWFLLVGVVPLSGWSSDYRWFGKKRQLRLFKPTR